MNSLAPDSVLKSRTHGGGRIRPDSTKRLEEQFEAAALEHRGFLMRIAVASTRNPTEAEDIVQEALLRGYRGLKGFRGDCPLRTWLARIVVRVSINHRRSFIRAVKRWTLFSDLGYPDSEGRTSTFDRAAPGARVDPEALIDLEKHVQRLPDAFKIPLLLLAVEGMTIPEIAAILEIPEGTVKSRIFYGRKRLKKGLKL